MKKYTIKKGNHYSNHLPKLVYNKRVIGAKVKFHSDCWFPVKTPDDYAINKLLGWSNGFHHKNSIRCGWRPSHKEGYIDLFFYIYDNSRRMDSYFTTVKCDDDFVLTMATQNNHITFVIGGNKIEFLDINYSGPKLGYLLFPYFGGNNVAPHDIHIDLKII